MPYVGRSVTTRSAEECMKSYEYVLSYQLPFLIQNAWTQPYAKTYVRKLMEEIPTTTTITDHMKGKLAVVTGVTIGGAGYHAAEELALQAGMHVIVLGRNERKRKAAIASIEKEAVKRNKKNKNKMMMMMNVNNNNHHKPTLYETAYDLDSLESARKAAYFVTKLAQDKYDGKLHVLLNNAGVAVAKPTLTKDGVEANVGRNFLTVHYLTGLLLPVLKAAAVPNTYKPRIVDIASIAHAFGVDFSPALLLEHPKLGGAPEGHVVEKDDGTIDFPLDPTLEGAAYMYGRAKMAVVAVTKQMQKKHPELNFTCLHPGSIASNFGGDLGIAAKVYYYGFYFFQYTSSQGAVAGLRACLDPDFNTEPDLQGAYLHADGNPWVPFTSSITSTNPTTNQPYTPDEFAEATDEAAEKLIQTCLSSSSSAAAAAAGSNNV